jgi:hypothetical protein
MPVFDQPTRLCNVIKQLKFDDALHFIGSPTPAAATPTAQPSPPIALSPYHVEYLSLSKGFAQYRLYDQNRLVGIVDVRDSKDGWVLKRCQRQLAVYLLALDGVADMTPHIVQMGTITPLDADTTRCPRLKLPTIDERDI